MSKLKILHPAQNLNIASRNENIERITNTNIANNVNPFNKRIVAEIDIIIPILAANLFGLNVIILSLNPTKGTTIFLDIIASILNFGVKYPLIKKSTTNIVTGIIDLVKIVTIEIIQTCIATPLTPCSFTLNGIFIFIILMRIIPIRNTVNISQHQIHTFPMGITYHLLFKDLN